MAQRAGGNVSDTPFRIDNFPIFRFFTKKCKIEKNEKYWENLQINFLKKKRKNIGKIFRYIFTFSGRFLMISQIFEILEISVLASHQTTEPPSKSQ